MDKEKILTVFLGLLVGGLLAGGYFASGKLLPLLNSKKQETITIRQKTANTTPVANPSLLTLSAPEDFLSTTETTITVTGKSVPKAKLVIFANADEKIATVAANGAFAIDIKLESGDNEITVTAFDPESSLQTTIIRNVVREIPNE